MVEPTEIPTLNKRIKRVLPVSLFGRALLILVLPMILVQLVAVYIFYERHWSSLSRNMSSSLAGEIATLVHDINLATTLERNYRKELAQQLMGVEVEFAERQAFLPERHPDPRFKEFIYQLERRLVYPVAVRQTQDEDVLIQVKLHDVTANITVSKKRLVSSTTYIFVLWMVGSALIILAVAVVFLRNQIRPITQLARAAEAFGRGEDVPEFRPSGAQEVRQAARAFLVMRGRIRRQVETRTTMLNAISHDLRTPLTRLRLQLEMKDASDPAIMGMRKDVEEMQAMIQEYLDFIRGAEGEESSRVSLRDFLEQLVKPYRDNGQAVRLMMEGDAQMTLRPRNMRRAFDNIIINALRYGKSCSVKATSSGGFALIMFEDEGDGIPEELFEEVFKPFRRLDPSRNATTGGAGLGLSIVRDIIQAHGGEIGLRNRKDENGNVKGLQVRMKIPLGS